MAQPRVAIVGGGISGLIFAMALDEKGIRSQIYEQSANFREIGAGVAFGENAIRAMRYCSPKVEEAFRAVSTGNANERDENGQLRWFDFADAYKEGSTPQDEPHYFHLTTEDTGSVHRAHFLDELVKHAPEDIAHFGKRLNTINEEADGTLRMKFFDDSTADADVVIGTDGIKSRVRQVIFGADNPCSHPVYTHKKVYRGLIPMDRAASVLGEERASNSHICFGKRGHILTFPVARGKIMNVAAFKHDDRPWPSATKLTLPSTKEEAIEDFKDFNETSRSIMDMLEPSLDCWGIFDTGDHPLPYYNKGRICLVGDAAHASAPHLGAGAGFCVEDAAVLSNILTQAKTKEDYATAFACYDAQRRERTQWLVANSRNSGDICDYMFPESGDDPKKCEAQLKPRYYGAWHFDTDAMIKNANEDMKQRLATTANGATNGLANGHT